MTGNVVTLFDLVKKCIDDLDFRRYNENGVRYCTLHVNDEFNRGTFTCSYLKETVVPVIEASSEGAKIVVYYQCCNGRLSIEERNARDKAKGIYK